MDECGKPGDARRKQYALTTGLTDPASELGADAALLKIRIGDLQTGATEPDIRALVLPYGAVRFYDRPKNELTHRPGTVAYLEMLPADGAAAIKALKGARVGGGVVTVEVAPPLASWAAQESRGTSSQHPPRTVTPQVERPPRGAAGA